VADTSETDHGLEGAIVSNIHGRIREYIHTLRGLPAMHAGTHLQRYLSYIFVISILLLCVAAFALSNSLLHFIRIDPAALRREAQIFAPANGGGYLAFAIIITFAPVPDYVLLPFYGYLASLGEFNIYLLAAISSLSMTGLSLLEYLAGRLAGRRLVLSILSKAGIRERDINYADEWIAKHGVFSMFLSTFIPYLKNAISVAAGTLRMNMPDFVLATLAGYLIRFSLLLYAGYAGVNLIGILLGTRNVFLTASVAALSSAYAVAYALQRMRRTHSTRSQ